MENTGLGVNYVLKTKSRNDWEMQHYLNGWKIGNKLEEKQIDLLWEVALEWKKYNTFFFSKSFERKVFIVILYSNKVDIYGNFIERG